MAKTIKPYGLWKSPITPRSLAQELRLCDLFWDSDGETLVWLEGRSDRGVLVAKRRGEAARDLVSDLSVRARVGYGGGDFTVFQGTVVFVADGRLFRQSLASGGPTPITPPFGQAASPVVSPDGRWVLFVHSDGVEDVVAVVDLEGRFWPQRFAWGHDFYMQPRWHPAGEKVAWISWDHPRMPWDGTTLELAALDLHEGRLPVVREVETVAGSETVSIFQPEFSPDGHSLAYIGDESGTGNLYLYDLAEKTHRALTQGKEEFSIPAWVQGLRTYGFSHDGARIIARASVDGIDRMKRIDLETGRIEPLDENFPGYTLLQQIAPSPTENAVAAIAQSATVSPRVITATLAPRQEPRVHAHSSTETVPREDLSVPEPVAWAAPDGGKVYGLYYSPQNGLFSGTGLPPAIVMVHGGPTSQYTAGYHASTQFFTSRGFAILEVNYRGSTGYGREYRKALEGNWGLVDVEDAVLGALYLAQSGRADRERLVIMGGSAGGYTVLRALTEHPGTFKAAISLYGVSNLFALAQDTHKFEAHYLDSLVGPLPEASAVYRERSPLFAADRIADPIAVFQGDEDKAVPKSQSDRIVASLERRGVPHEYHVYAGEGHGWRKAETIEAYWRDVERFLRERVVFA
jgi:dipeptidyl aminopeptidase/acylaminoacyl peptidase